MKTLCLITCHRWHQIIVVSACLTILCLLWPGSAMAHRVNIFAWVEGDTIHTQSKFSGGKVVKGGEVVVYDLDGSQLLSGKTDAHGEFSFKIPKKTGMKIVIQAGMGHRGEWTIPAHEIEGLSESKTTSAASPETVSKTPEGQAAISRMNLVEIRQVVEKSLDQKLNPVLKILVEAREAGPTLRDILGGVGYILGLMGLAAYIHFRRKAAEIEGNKAD
jgi:nickel transport protein